MKKEIIIIMVLAAILLSVITIARPGGILAGEEAYYHLSVASTQEKNSMTAIERPVFASEYDYLLGAAFLFFNPILFMKIFPIIIGAVCAVLFYLVSKRIIDFGI